jgi:hypothetical protein
MATLEQLKNLEVPEGYQNRAGYLFSRGNVLSKDKDEKIHALNCYKKALKLFDEGRSKFHNYDFYVPISFNGLTLMLNDIRKDNALERLSAMTVRSPERK